MTTLPSYSIGVVIALIVLVVCVVGLILAVLQPGLEVPTAAALFLIGAALAVARLT